MTYTDAMIDELLGQITKALMCEPMSEQGERDIAAARDIVREWLKRHGPFPSQAFQEQATELADLRAELERQDLTWDGKDIGVRRGFSRNWGEPK